MNKTSKTVRSEKFNGQTLLDLLEYTSRQYNQLPALKYVGQTGLSHKELSEKAASLRAVLQQRGIRKGTKVALLSENRPEWGVCYLAVVTMGAVIVPVMPDFHADEIANILEHSESALVVVSERFRQILPESFPVMALESVADLPKESLDNVEERPEAADMAAIIYTSGTTGQSKGVMLSHRNIVSNAIASTDIPELNPGDSLLSVLPLSHTYECTIGFLVPLLMGGNISYLEKPPSATVLMAALKTVRPHAMLTVPLFMEKIYKAKIQGVLNTGFVRILKNIPLLRQLVYRKAGKSLLESFGGRMKFFGVGGAALSPQVEKFLMRARFPYAAGYGLTETSPLIAGANAFHTRFRQIGPVIDGVDVKIDYSKGRTGEVLVKGPNVMMGYYKDEKKTAEVMDEDGYFHTGDLGSFDRKGYLGLKGRLKSMILGASGENIYPEAIEATLNRFRFVTDSLVVKQGNVLIARVQLDKEALQEHIAELKGNARDKIADMKADVDEILKHLQKEANAKLNRFSRLSGIVEQKEPFKKTPTLKIKRYLYQ